MLVEIDPLEVEVADGRPAHAGADEAIDDRSVAVGPIAFAPGALVGELHLLAAPPVLRAAAEDRQVVGGIEELAPVAFGERPFDLEAGAAGSGLELVGRVAETEGAQGVDPLGEGFQVGGDAGDRPIRKAAPAFLIDLFAQGIEERPGEAAGPQAAVV